MTVQGTVQSHTVIRVPDKAHAAVAPFVLLLVELADGKRVLGHFHRRRAAGDRQPRHRRAIRTKTLVFREESAMKLEPITRANRPSARKC